MPEYSLIYKNMDFEVGKNESGVGNFKYKGRTISNTLYIHSSLDKYDLLFSGFLAIESTSNKSGIESFTDDRSAIFSKAGISLGLLF